MRHALLFGLIVLFVPPACVGSSARAGREASPIVDGEAGAAQAPTTSAGTPAAPTTLPVPLPLEHSTVDCNAIWQDTANHGKYWYEDNPNLTERSDTSGPWVVASAASVGLNDDVLENGLTWLKNGCGTESCTFLQSAIVIRHGRLIKEAYFNGASANRANNIHSAQKSFLGALVGIAIREGFIASVKEPICTYLAAEWPDACMGDKAKITIEDLLTMRSGLEWNEDDAEQTIQKTRDWAKQLLLLPQAQVPGTTFNYATANTHLMSKVLTNATRTSTCDFGHRYLFGHLGMTAEHWATDDRDIFFGGCNSYWTPREMARFGRVMLDHGAYNGFQVIPAQWVDESLANHVHNVHVSSTAPHDYGYWYWNRTIASHEVKKAWGFAGQMIYLIPSLDIVAVNTTTTGPNQEMRDIDFDTWVERYVVAAVTGN
jgi:CubicO group peptidase (beta-lactamase class C family)